MISPAEPGKSPPFIPVKEWLLAVTLHMSSCTYVIPRGFTFPASRSLVFVESDVQILGMEITEEGCGQSAHNGSFNIIVFVKTSLFFFNRTEINNTIFLLLNTVAFI